MTKLTLILVLAAAVLVAVTGCKCHSGSREYTPGQGWQQN